MIVLKSKRKHNPKYLESDKSLPYGTKKRKHNSKYLESDKHLQYGTKRKKHEDCSLINHYTKDRLINDNIKDNFVHYQIKNRLIQYTNRVLKYQNVIKFKCTLDLIGCSAEQLKQHLESKFTEGMTWEKYGINGWVVDHILPVSYFDFTKEENQRICFNYLNTQPLWSNDNHKKYNHLPENYQEIIEVIKNSLNLQINFS